MDNFTIFIGLGKHTRNHASCICFWVGADAIQFWDMPIKVATGLTHHYLSLLAISSDNLGRLNSFEKLERDMVIRLFLGEYGNGPI